MRYYEDFEVGEVTEVGPVSVTEDEIVEFATRYDPQPFHIDPEAAKSSPFGVDAPLRQGEEHERVVGVRAVGEGDAVGGGHAAILFRAAT